MPPLASLQRRRLPTAGRGTGAAAGAPQRSSDARCAPRAERRAIHASPHAKAPPSASGGGKGRPPQDQARQEWRRVAVCALPSPCGPTAALLCRDARNRAPEMPPLTCSLVCPIDSLQCSHTASRSKSSSSSSSSRRCTAHIPPLTAQQQQQHCAADAGGPSALDELDELPLPRRTPPGSRSTCGGRPASRELLQRLWCDDEGVDGVMAAQEQRPRQQGQAGHGAAGGVGGRVGGGEVGAWREAASCLSDQAAGDIEPLYAAAAMDRAGAKAAPTVLPAGTALLDVRRSISMETAVFMR